MTATENLENDHVHILKLCDVMERIINKNEIEISHLESIVNIIRNFADGLHHRKEEELLFPKMSEKGFSLHSGPVAVMLNDHEAGRSYVKGITTYLMAYKPGDKAAQKIIYANMQGYIDLLRSHIAKENNVLFRMADNSLSAEEQQSLLLEFDKTETAHSDQGTFVDFVAQIEDLAKQYGIQ